VLTPDDVPSLSKEFTWNDANYWTVEMTQKDIDAIGKVNRDLANEFETITQEMLDEEQEERAGAIAAAEAEVAEAASGSEPEADEKKSGAK